MSSDEQIENAVDQIGKSFSLTVTERINTQPGFRREILRQVIECVESDDLLVAKKMLDQVLEADEGVDKRIMYEIILGKDIRPGDTIIYNSLKALVTSVAIGNGAGSFDFGTYIIIKAVNHKNNDSRIEFLTFENCPVVKEIDERN